MLLERNGKLIQFLFSMTNLKEKFDLRDLVKTARSKPIFGISISPEPVFEVYAIKAVM